MVHVYVAATSEVYTDSLLDAFPIILLRFGGEHGGAHGGLMVKFAGVGGGRGRGAENTRDILSFGVVGYCVRHVEK